MSLLIQLWLWQALVVACRLFITGFSLAAVRGPADAAPRLTSPVACVGKLLPQTYVPCLEGSLFPFFKEGIFLTTGPPGKSLDFFNGLFICLHWACGEGDLVPWLGDWTWGSSMESWLWTAREVLLMVILAGTVNMGDGSTPLFLY